MIAHIFSKIVSVGAVETAIQRDLLSSAFGHVANGHFWSFSRGRHHHDYHLHHSHHLSHQHDPLIVITMIITMITMTLIIHTSRLANEKNTHKPP